MIDMLVNLYKVDIADESDLLAGQGIVLKRAMALDKTKILGFVDQYFNAICAGWVAECEVALLQQPGSCFIAVHDKQVVGFCCYDASAKGFVGPLGVHPDFRNKGIAVQLLRITFEAMKQAGYAYGVIGWVSSEDFYADRCGAVAIPDSDNGLYSRLI